MRFEVKTNDCHVKLMRPERKAAYFKGALAANEGKGFDEPGANPYHRRDFRNSWQLGWLALKEGNAEVVLI